MQNKTGGRRTARTAAIEEASAADGLVARMVERAIDNPAMTGGLFVMALTAAAIVSNALVLQTGRHPGPLFITRPDAVETSAPVPIPRVRISQPEAPVVPAQAEPAPLPVQAGETVDSKQIAKLQRALTAKGLYRGAADGVLGSRTKAAISAFEKANGLPVTGLPSTLLLDTIDAQPAKAPVKPKPAAMLPAPTDALVVGSTPPKPVPAPRPIKTVAAPPNAAEPLPVVAPSPAVIPTAAPDPVALAQRHRLQDVQNMLNRIGYGPLAANGDATEETANAIRRFELDNGLPISGTPNERVISRLAAIGAAGSG